MHSFKNHILYQFGFLISPEKLEELTALVFPRTQHSQNAPCSFSFFPQYLSPQRLYFTVCMCLLHLFFYGLYLPPLACQHKLAKPSEVRNVCSSVGPEHLERCLNIGGMDDGK